MEIENNDFLKALARKSTKKVPLYCTGYPESEFIENYIKAYKIMSDHNLDFILNEKDYSIIKNMGFDAISILDYRRGYGGYDIDNQLRVDGWGRIYNKNWYLWDGVIKNENILDTWNHLTLPSEEKIALLEIFIKKIKNQLISDLSLPGLFEKSWQCMGFVYFSKCLKRNRQFIEKVILFFSNYVKNLIKLLQKAGVSVFLVADDCGYKRRTFIPESLWKELYFDLYKEIVRLVHSQNQKIIIHSDGYISNMMDIFIDIGFDAVQSLEPNAGVEIFELFKKYSNKICFIGNLDVSTLLSFGTAHDVKKYVVKLIVNARDANAPLVISPTQQILSTIKVENVKTMIETAKSIPWDLAINT